MFLQIGSFLIGFVVGAVFSFCVIGFMAGWLDKLFSRL